MPPVHGIYDFVITPILGDSSRNKFSLFAVVITFQLQSVDG